jgi:hypothetical protein
MSEAFIEFTRKVFKAPVDAVNNIVPFVRGENKSVPDGKPEKPQAQSVVEVAEDALNALRSLLGVSGGTEGKSSDLSATNPRSGAMGDDNAMTPAKMQEKKAIIDQAMGLNQPKTTN